MGPASRLNSLRLCVRCHFSQVRRHDPIFLGPALGPKANESCVTIQAPRCLGLTFLNIIICIIIKSINIKNIIICVINIIIFIIIKSINTENSIICVINIIIFIIIESINIKNSIICVINIIILIIINIINKIINKFKKNYYQY